MNKKSCDDAFKIQMTKEYNTSNLDDYALTWCRDLAEVYYDGVSKKGWADYRDSQIKNCTCCQ